MGRVLTLRELNRATLARQMLLQRESLPITEVVEWLGGLQSQIPNPPYIGLWTRLADFQRDAITEQMQNREIVHVPYLCSTLIRRGLLSPLPNALERGFWGGDKDSTT